jgi:ribosomal-protein-alanine N-acetyltransferase
MRDDDLAEVENIDHASFPPIWQNSLAGLRKAYQQTGIRTVAVKDEKIIGYQISTTMTIYGHLARLAVHPKYQEQGIGYGLVYDLLKQFNRLGLLQITVNTQSNNLPSHRLYRQLGFFPTGDEIPVYVLTI